MNKFALILSGFALFATAATAQETETTENQIDCEDEANEDDEACVILPGAGDVQNLVLGFGPALAGAGLLVASELFGSTTTTTTTTSTVSTN